MEIGGGRLRHFVRNEKHVLVYNILRVAGDNVEERNMFSRNFVQFQGTGDNGDMGWGE
jgi:hypothetical protein